MADPDAVIFAQTDIEASARVYAAVVDSGVTIARNAVVGEPPPGTRVGDGRLVLIGKDTRVGLGVVIPAGARLEPGSSA